MAIKDDSIQWVSAHSSNTNVNILVEAGYKVAPKTVDGVLIVNLVSKRAWSVPKQNTDAYILYPQELAAVLLMPDFKTARALYVEYVKEAKREQQNH